MEGPLPSYVTGFAIDWEQLGYEDWPSRRPADLKYPINPIFSQHTGSFWGTDAEYSMIEPAIRLASAYLSTPKSMLFIYSLVYECKRLPSQFDFKGETLYQFRRTTERDPKVVLPRIYRVWHEVANHNVWGPGGPNALAEVNSAFERGLEGVSGRARLPKDDYNALDGPDLKGNMRIGFNTYMGFNDWHLEVIEQLYSENKADSLQMLALQFVLAGILCHEAIHVIYQASNWQSRLGGIHARKHGTKWPRRRFMEPYFEDQSTPEVGYAWENEIFGGRIGTDYTYDLDYVAAVLFRAWPDCDRTSNTEPPELGIDGRRVPYRGDYSRTPDEIFIASMHYIYQVQQQSFWNAFWRSVEMQPDFEHDLRIPRSFAIRCDFIRWGNVSLRKLLRDELSWSTLSKTFICTLLWILVDRYFKPDTWIWIAIDKYFGYLGIDIGQICDYEVCIHRKSVPRTICSTAYSDQPAPKENKRRLLELPFPVTMNRKPRHSQSVLSRFKAMLSKRPA